jgi:putative ABC transport system permease protein
MFRGQAPAIALDGWAAIAFGGAGIAAAMLGSFVPAREAARASPALSLKAGDIDVPWHGAHARTLGLAALFAGAACTLLPPVGGLPLGGYAAIALLLLGTLRLLPDLSALFFAAVRRFMAFPAARALPLRLALSRIAHTPAQATLSLTALVAAVALMVAMAVMVASFRASLDAWLGNVLPADVYVRAGRGDAAWFPPDVVERVAALPGIARVEAMRSTAVMLDPSGPPVALLARTIDRADPGARLALVRTRSPAAAPASEAASASRATSASGPAAGSGASAASAAAAPSPPPVWISEAVADRLGWQPGARVTLPVAGRAVAFVVEGVFRDYARQQGAVVVARDTFARLTGDDRADELALWLHPGAGMAEVSDEVRALAPQAALDIATPAELRRVSLAIFDRTFAITYALEAVAIAIGLAGLSSAFGAEVLMRRRELGMLRHLGLTRAQVSAMLAGEGLALAGFGVIVGVALGLVIAQILIHVVNRQSFHWSMDLHVPGATLALLAAMLVLLAMASAWLAGRRALATDAVRAVREDW